MADTPQPMADNPNMIGYFGVIVPPRRFWQIFVLSAEFAAAAETALHDIKRALGGRYMPPSAVIRGLHHVADADQPWVGAVSAGLVACALTGDPLKVGLLSMVLHHLTGFTHFYLIGTPDRSGTATTIVNLPDADSADAVHAVMQAHPEVVRAKQALSGAILTGSQTRH